MAWIERTAYPRLSGSPSARELAESFTPSADELALEARHREISEMVEEQPDEVAQLLRGWLAERRG